MVLEFESRRSHKNNSHNYSNLVIHLRAKITDVAVKGRNVALKMKKNSIPRANARAKLVIPKPDSKDQRWIVTYYIWDASKQKIIRKRDTTLNSITDMNLRAREGKSLVNKYNRLIEMGYYFDPEKVEREKPRNVEILTINKTFELFLSAKKDLVEKDILRKTTIHSYSGHLGIFSDWLKEHELSTIHPSELSRESIKSFLKYLMGNRDLGARSHNNYLATITTFYNWAKKNGIVEKSPLEDIATLPEPAGKNVAFTYAQQEELIDYMKKHKPHYLFASLFMYYTLFRTNEMSFIRREYLWYGGDKIYLPKQYSKNKTDRFATITTQLDGLMRELGIDKLPMDTFIFSQGFRPSSTKYESSYMGRIFRKRVLNKLKYPKEYTFYSWKHTGVVSAWNSGVDPNAIYQQGGWKSWKSFQQYLRSLGLFENREVKYKYPTPPGM